VQGSLPTASLFLMAASSSRKTSVVSTKSELQDFLCSITDSSTLYLDLEGHRLSRNGTIAIITILVYPQNVIGLVDVTTLGSLAFTQANDGKSLKSILENRNIPKYLWDLRNDADALWALYGIGLAGVTDIQLLENASRSDDKTYVRGLDKSIQYDLKLGFMEIHRWLRVKSDFRSLMSTDIFATRPLDDKTIQYCCNDVTHLPALRALYLGRIQDDWLPKVEFESANRVTTAHSAEYDPQSSTKKLGPWGSQNTQPKQSFDEWLDQLEDDMLEQRANDIFGDDDTVGYYDDDPWDGSSCNAADGAMDPEAFDSCWDKGS
jgi:exonuclease 3'-5' domain-containing protein 1